MAFDCKMKYSYCIVCQTNTNAFNFMIIFCICYGRVAFDCKMKYSYCIVCKTNTNAFNFMILGVDLFFVSVMDVWHLIAK